MKTHEINGKTYFEPETIIPDKTMSEIHLKCMYSRKECGGLECKNCLFNYDKKETVQAYKSIYKKSNRTGHPEPII